MLYNTQNFKNKTRKDTRIKFYKTMVIPVLLYGSKVQVTTKKYKAEFKGSELKFLRETKGTTVLDDINNETIRKELDVKSIYKKYNSI